MLSRYGNFRFSNSQMLSQWRNGFRPITSNRFQFSQIHTCAFMNGKECDPPKLTHVDKHGDATMVNVGSKGISTRTATARCEVVLGKEAFDLVSENRIKKGDVLTVAKIAGIMAAKNTSHFIPLCHQIPLSHVDIKCLMNEENYSIIIDGSATTTWTTGVEMEALVATSIAALTIYDMCKAVTHKIKMCDLRLISKTGGVSGDYKSE
ncbi:Cyclic pyranopterin monophosphate synthase, mitochondrial [Chamberlinius hualienensis]